MSSPTEEPSCGAELAASAEVPAAFARLLRHVAINLHAHAAWVEHSDPSCDEHQAMKQVAEAYEDIATAAESAATMMRSFATLSRARHDRSAFDVAAFTHWMREKIMQQRALARLLIDHATASERGLMQIETDSL